MLVVRSDWSQYATDAVIAELYEQIPRTPLRRVFAKHLIGATLEVRMAECKQPPTLSVEETSTEIRWRFGDLIYAYFPDVDDAALEKAVEYSSIATVIAIIVPPGYDWILWSGCTLVTTIPDQPMEGRRTRRESSRSQSLAMQTSKECCMPWIFPLHTYIAIRTCDAEIDRQWPRDRVILDLLRRYNQRVVDSARDKAILVDIPTG